MLRAERQKVTYDTVFYSKTSKTIYNVSKCYSSHADPDPVL